MRFLGFALIAVLATATAGAGEERPENWRDAYKDSMFAPHAIADLDQARAIMADEIGGLVEERELTANGAAVLEHKLADLEYKYIVKWYGPPEEQAMRNAQRRGAVRSNASYDTQYREPARSSTGPLPPK